MSNPLIDITPSGMEDILHARRYFAQALDPIHIVREAGTDLPKLPGTSLSGACRAYAALQNKDSNANKFGCAGQGNEKLPHCGKCPVCRAFGYAKKGGTDDQSGQKGTAQFTDAHIIAFPVKSTNSPLWVTSADALTHISKKVPDAEIGVVQSNNTALGDIVAIGWLALKRKDLPASLPDIPEIDAKRLVLVPNDLFPTIVNDNLEVRTSVAIDPETGAAEDGALFTYEALPMGTVVAFTITYQGKELPETPSEARKTVESGMALFPWLGVGGMNTRGMGRLRVLGLEAHA
jgi:CRISPR-associated protein Cmr4